MGKRYYPAYFNFKKAGKQFFFVNNVNDNTTHTVSASEMEILMYLSGCKILKDHMKTISETEWDNISSEIMSDLFCKWVKNGFLREEKLLSIKKINQKTFPDTTEILSCCITYKRPGMLKKWMESRITSSDYRNAEINIVVCDDTSNQEDIQKNINIINNCSKKYPGEIFHINKDNKQIFAQKIKQRLQKKPAEEMTDFSMSLEKNLFNGKTTGSNRNTLILATAGNKIYSSDDDVEYSLFLKKDEKELSYLFSENYVYNPIFTPDIDHLTDKNKINNNYNLINKFQEITGEELSTSAIKNFQLRDIPSRTAMLIEKGSYKIQTVSAGYCGGRWYQNPYLPLLQENGRCFFDNTETYNNIKNNGFNINSSEDFIMDCGDFLMGGTYATDNRNIIPPCLPLGRREDTNFGILLNRCFNYGLTLHLPFALYHNCEKKTPFTFDHFNDVSLDTGVFSTLIIRKLASNFMNSPGKERLKELGLRFLDFGNQDNSDFDKQLKLLQLEYITGILKHISYLIDLHDGQPEWWIKDMINYRELLKNEALSKNSVIPKELRIFKNKEKALNTFRHYINKCGEMLFWWPEIWETAKEINGEGKGIINR